MKTRRTALSLMLAGLCAAATLATPAVWAQAAWQSYTYIPAATQAPARGVARIAEAMKGDGLALRSHLNILGLLTSKTQPRPC